MLRVVFVTKRKSSKRNRKTSRNLVLSEERKKMKLGLETVSRVFFFFFPFKSKNPLENNTGRGSGHTRLAAQGATITWVRKLHYG